MQNITNLLFEKFIGEKVTLEAEVKILLDHTEKDP